MTTGPIPCISLDFRYSSTGCGLVWLGGNAMAERSTLLSPCRPGHQLRPGSMRALSNPATFLDMPFWLHSNLWHIPISQEDISIYYGYGITIAYPKTWWFTTRKNIAKIWSGIHPKLCLVSQTTAARVDHDLWKGQWTSCPWGNRFKGGERKSMSF